MKFKVQYLFFLFLFLACTKDVGLFTEVEFEFTEIAGTQLSGSVVEMTEPIAEFSEMFDVEVKKFKKSAKFMQKLMPAEGKRLIKGMVTYMACDANRCLPPKSIPFEVE